MRPRRLPSPRTLAAIGVLAVLGPTAVAAQPVGITATPQPTPGRAAETAEPTPTQAPPVTAPQPSAPLPTPAPTPVPATPSPSAGTATPTPSPAASPSRTIPPGFQLPVIARTPARNTTKLVSILQRATQVGIPLEHALQEGFGRFPVAGPAWYSDDWLNPRFTPYFHLHEGLDIFADFGTAVRSPDRGTVSQLTTGVAGGISVWVTGQDGLKYYFAHLQDYAEGVRPGMRVEIGTVLGYVGDSGNAVGGAPHLHFEIQKGGVSIPPKPTVDKWLLDAERDAQAWVDNVIDNSLAERQLLRTEHTLAPLLAEDTTVPSSSPEYSLVLSLLDPIGGTAGVFPRLTIVADHEPARYAGLLEEVVKRRVDGSVLDTLGRVSGGDAGSASRDAR